jgi:hypothetical protein
MVFSMAGYLFLGSVAAAGDRLLYLARGVFHDGNFAHQRRGHCHALGATSLSIDCTFFRKRAPPGPFIGQKFLDEGSDLLEYLLELDLLVADLAQVDDAEFDQLELLALHGNEAETQNPGTGVNAQNDPIRRENACHYCNI